MKRIIVVAPHPDDETLGAGGFLLKRKKQGDEIYWLIVTDVKEEYGYSKEKCATRSTEIKKVKEAFGFKKVYNLGLEPAGLDKYETGDLVRKISAVFQEVLPNIVILPNEADVHSDHGVVFRAAYACTKAFRYPQIKMIMCMEILSETEYTASECAFSPNYFVNIEEYIGKKIQIANIYKSEIQSPPFPRSVENIEALSIFRGGGMCVRNAEGFRIIRIMED